MADIDHDSLREQFDFEVCINKLKEVGNELEIIEGDIGRLGVVAMATNKKAITNVVSFQKEALKDKLAILKERANFYFRQLKFGLPELKSMEITTGNISQDISWVVNLAEQVHDNGSDSTTE